MGRDHHDREDRTAHRSICLGNCMSPGRDSVTRAILSKISSNFEQSSFSHGQPCPQTYLQLNFYETYSQDMSGDSLRSHRSPVSSLIHSRNGSGYLKQLLGSAGAWGLVILCARWQMEAQLAFETSVWLQT